MKFFNFVILIFICTGLYLNARDVKIVDFKTVDNLLASKNDTTFFVNFWATWCIPCRNEIPYIEQINNKYKNKKFKIILISLDFPSKIDISLKPYLVENNVQSEVWLLDEKDPNTWINKVDPSWTGAIPASIFFNKNGKHFFEKSFTFDELNEIVSSLIIDF